MKNLLLGLCLVGLTFACKSNDNMSVDDAANANMPAAECCGSDAKSECSGDMKAECSGEMKAECSSMKAECSGAAATECTGEVCPVTGKPMN